MELFSVICTTCQSKLKVRERAVIGQILACPKCRGMVLVEPPAGWTDPGDAPPGAPGVSAAPHPAPAKSAPAETPASHFEEAAALLERPAPSAAAPVDAPPAPLPPPSAEWISPQTQALRRWLLVGGSAALGLLVLASLGIYLLSGPGPSAAALPAAPGEDAATVAQEDPAEEATNDPAHDDPMDEEPAPADERGSDVAQTPAAGIPAAEASTPGASAPDAPRELSAIAPQSPEEEPPAVAAAEPPEAPMEPQPLNVFNVDGSLEKFGALLEDRPPPPSSEPLSDPPEPEETEGSAPAVTMLTTDEEPLPRPEPRKVDIARRLADPLEAIEMSDVPLADFLQLLVDMTAMPITLEPTALPAIKTSPEAKVSVRLKGTTVGHLLAEGLRPLGLAYVADDAHVVVLPAASAKGELREIKHDLGDLAKTEAEATILAEIVHAVIAPESWDDAGGAGSLKVEGTQLVVVQSPEAHFAIVVLCEKLRLARGLPRRTAYPAAVVSLTPRVLAADGVLDTPVTVNFVPPTRVGRVADYLQRTTGLRVLIDWRAVAEAGWSPEGEVKAGVANQPLAAFLDQWTRRMEIRWRVIDAGTVQLTTTAGLIAAADVEVYPLETTDSAALLARLHKQLGADWFAPGGGGALRYDARGGCLVARLPQPQQRRLIEILARGL